mmetsp:Transcript_16751/g.38775  ORF Transcript_16751/g.38775 Transcript_16751/m.38775 type:complete len:414 (-) Transcript_16751:1156-2397(-)
MTQDYRSSWPHSSDENAMPWLSSEDLISILSELNDSKSSAVARKSAGLSLEAERILSELERCPRPAERPTASPDETNPGSASKAAQEAPAPQVPPEPPKGVFLAQFDASTSPEPCDPGALLAANTAARASLAQASSALSHVAEAEAMCRASIQGLSSSMESYDYTLRGRKRELPHGPALCSSFESRPIFAVRGTSGSAPRAGRSIANSARAARRKPPVPTQRRRPAHPAGGKGALFEFREEIREEIQAAAAASVPSGCSPPRSRTAAPAAGAAVGTGLLFSVARYSAASLPPSPPPSPEVVAWPPFFLAAAGEDGLGGNEHHGPVTALCRVGPLGQVHRVAVQRLLVALRLMECAGLLFELGQVLLSEDEEQCLGRAVQEVGHPPGLQRVHALVARAPAEALLPALAVHHDGR